MSRVYIMVVDKRGRVEHRDEARNANAFHVAIWNHLLMKYKLAAPHRHFPDQAERGMELDVLGRIWSRAGKIDRADGLALAATFDRCWFPSDSVPALRDALRAVQRGIPSHFVQALTDVAGRLDTLELARTDRGVTFGSSLADSWWCSRRDDHHRIAVHGHKCTTCGKRIQHAIHMLDEQACCKEDEEATYADDTRD